MGIFSKKKGDKKSQPSVPNVPPATPAAVAPVPVAPRRPWDGSKFRIHLKMAKNRVDIQRGKKDNEVAAIRRVIATHLTEKKEPLARIQGERVLRERTQIIAFDIIDTCIDVLSSSNNAFTSSNDFTQFPADVKQAIASTLYASGRVNVPELLTVCDMLRNHFGAHITDPLVRMEGDNVIYINNVLAQKLSGIPPDGHLILKELMVIAMDYNVDWNPPPEESDLNDFGYSSAANPPPPGFGGASHPPPNFGGGGGVGSPFYQPSAPEASDLGSAPSYPTNIPGFSQGADSAPPFSNAQSPVHHQHFPAPPPPPGPPMGYPGDPDPHFPPGMDRGMSNDDPSQNSSLNLELQTKFQRLRGRSGQSNN